MSIQRIFSVILCIIAVFGIIGASSLQFVTAGNISDGFAPMLYAIFLFVCSIVLFFKEKPKEKFSIRAWLLEGAHGKASVFFLANMLLIPLMFLFGPLISMIIFCFLASFALKRQSLRGMVVFSAVYVVIVYVLFVQLLKMPFDRGFIFDLMLGDI